MTCKQAKKQRMSSGQEVIIREDQRTVLKAQVYQATTKKIKTAIVNMQAIKKKYVAIHKDNGKQERKIKPTKITQNKLPSTPSNVVIRDSITMLAS